MSIMRFVRHRQRFFSILVNLPKNIEKHITSRIKMRPPYKLKLRIYLAGFLAICTGLHNALGTSGAGGFI